MLPEITYEQDYEEDDALLNDFDNNEEFPNLTYKLDFKNGRIREMCDDEEALKQAIYKLLNTEFGEFLIYEDYDYGIQKNDLYGMPMDYVQSEIKDRATEAILADDRFESVENFEFEKARGKLSVSFMVITEMEEEIYIENGVEINV